MEKFVEHVHQVSLNDFVLNHVLLSGLDDDLLIILILPHVYELSLVDFINRVLGVMGSSFCVKEAEKDSRDVFPVPSYGGWIAPAHPKPPPESSTFLVSTPKFPSCSTPEFRKQPAPEHTLSLIL